MNGKGNSFYDLVTKDQLYLQAVTSASKKSVKNLKEIERVLKFPLRPYQLEALSVFELFWNNDFDSRSLKQKVLQKVEVVDDSFEWPKVGFEMATGSGKTLLMGAVIFDLWLKGHKDFLILTPNTILFDKTVENFTPRQAKSIFGDGWNLSYNLVTGNSYRDKTSGFEDDKDISFYVFNMQKFYDKGTSEKSKKLDSMKNVPYVRRPIEESPWKDDSGKHTIPFIDFLKQRRPIIISDEAHHYQQSKTREAILELLPSAVLEFTATSSEKKSSSDEGQDNLYKYPMQRYISEGYGKRIFALGCGVSDDAINDSVNESDKQKLVWGMLVHLLKKESLKVVNAPVKKPMILIKARSIKHADNIDKYLKEWPDGVSKEVDDVFDQLEREKTDVVKTIYRNLFKNKRGRASLKKDMEVVAKSVFTIHYKNKTDEEVWTDYKSLDDNEAEIVNQVRVFTEGVDYDNFYTIVVLGDTTQNTGFSAAQLIGRGLRLYKEKREFDLLDHDLKEQSEILHVICDRGRRFDQIVETIRKNLELTQSLIETPTEEDERENPIRTRLIDDYSLPVLQIKNIPTGITFEEALKNKNLSIDEFIKETCTVIRGQKILKPEITSLVEETEVTSPTNSSPVERPETTRKTLTISREERERWALRFIEDTGAFVGNNAYPVILKRITDIIDQGIQVDGAYAQDFRTALKALEKSIVSFHEEKAYELMFQKKYSTHHEKAKNIFKNSGVVIRKRSGWTNLIPKYQQMTANQHQKGVVVEGYKYSLKPFVKLDTVPEKLVSDALEKLCGKDSTGKSFWVRNEPRTEYAVEVRPAPFYPDFLTYIKGKWAVVDVKGKHLSETRQIDDRKRALKLLELEGQIKTFFLLDEVMTNKGFGSIEFNSIDDFREFDELRNQDINEEDFANRKFPTLFDNNKKNLPPKRAKPAAASGRRKT